MFTVIFAEFPFALKKNGILCEFSFDGAIKLNLDLDKPDFIEIIPLKQSVLPTAFLFDEKFLSTPEKNISKTNLKGAFFIKILPLYIPLCADKVAEKKSDYGVISVYGENLKILTITTKHDVFTQPFDGLSEVKTDFFTYGGNPFAYCFFEKTLNVYALKGKITKVLTCPADEFFFKDKLIAVKSFNDVAKHKVTYYYTCNGVDFVLEDKKVEVSTYFSLNALNKKVIRVPFFEGLICGEDLTAYLADNLIDKQSKLNSYLGDFIGVLPAPEFRSLDETGLIYKVDENLYEVKYCKTQLDGRKISNLKLLE